MTEKELLKVGFAKLHPGISKDRTFFIPDMTHKILYINIPSYYTLPMILEVIFDKGMEAGIEIGGRDKANQIKKCLNIEENT